MTSYELSRTWFDWAFENPEKIKPSHTALFFWIIEQANRMGWKEKFGLPTLHSMELLGIKSKNTYYSSLKDLVDWGFIIIIEKSKNQNSANIISISAASNFESAGKSALDSALIQHVSQQVNSTCVSGGNIDKQINKETKKQDNIEEGEKKSNFLRYKNEIIKSRIYTESLCIKFKLKIDCVDKILDNFIIHLNLKSEKDHPEDLDRFKNYFLNWIIIQDRTGDLNEFKKPKPISRVIDKSQIR